MRHPSPRLPLGTLSCTLAVLVVAGCAECRMPRLDPSGEHLFIQDQPPPPVTCPPGTVSAPAVPVPTPAPAAAVPSGLQPIPMTPPPTAVSPLVSPYSDVAVTLAPCSRVAPIGAEVILVAGVRGGDNYLRTNRRLDWSLAPGSVGQFTDIGRKRFEDYLVADYSRPRISSPTTAIGTTSRVGQGDSIYVARGETWIALRSPVEGVSRVTVLAPEVVIPAERAKTATVYWYDAQYSFPEPVVTPPGTKGILTTTVWKLTNHCPREGWIVRYELTGGPQAIFVPSASTAVEVPTDSTGRASVEIVQKDPSPGTSQIRVQLFRPADQCSPRFLVRDGCTAVSWTDATAQAVVPASPALPGPISTTPSTATPPAATPPPTVTPPPSGTPSPGTPPPVSVLDVKIAQRTPPADVVVGSNVTFSLDVMNRGTTTAREVLVRDTYDAGLEPQTRGSASGPQPTTPVTVTVNDLHAGDSRQFSLTFRVTKAGRLCHRVEALASDGGRASQDSCVTAALAAETPRPPAAPPSTGGPNVTPPPAAPAAIPLEIRLTAERTTATVGQSVVFTANIRNLSQQPLANLTIGQHADAALDVRRATEGAKPRDGQFVWDIPLFPPEKEVSIKAECQCVQPAAKAYCYFTVTLPDGRPIESRTYVEIVASSPPREGPGTTPPPAVPSRLAIKVENRNVVRAGGNQQFEVHISNEGEATENDILVTAQLPPGSQLVPGPLQSFGPEPGMKVEQQGSTVSFGLLASLQPKDFRSYRITITTSRPGPIKLESEVSSRRQSQPISGSKTVEVSP